MPEVGTSVTTLVAPTDLPREYCETAAKQCNQLDKGDIDRCRRFDCALRFSVATGWSLKCEACADRLIEMLAKYTSEALQNKSHENWFERKWPAPGSQDEAVERVRES